MNLTHLSNESLHAQTKSSAEKERLSTIEVLWHLRENEKRMLYAQVGYRDLKEYCVKELKYSEGSAWRRISAMKLLKDIPEVEAKISCGELNLTQVSMAQSLFRQIKPSIEEKKEILESLENKTTIKSERILAEHQPLVIKPEVIEKPLRGERLDVTLTLDKELQDELEEIQLLLGKKYSKLELFKLMAKEKLENLRKSERKAQPLRSKTALSSTRSISAVTERELKARDDKRCQYRDPQTNRQCEARHNLQIDHIKPWAKQGSNDISNLQLLCPNHNRLRAVQEFGVQKMQDYLPSLR